MKSLIRHSHHRLVPIILFAIGMVIAGTLMFMYLEGWHFIDALYYTVATITTVGYGDFVPTHLLSRIIAVIYMVLTIPFVLISMGVVADSVYQYRKEQEDHV